MANGIHFVKQIAESNKKKTVAADIMTFGRPHLDRPIFSMDLPVIPNVNLFFAATTARGKNETTTFGHIGVFTWFPAHGE